MLVNSICNLQYLHVEEIQELYVPNVEEADSTILRHAAYSERECPRTIMFEYTDRISLSTIYGLQTISQASCTGETDYQTKYTTFKLHQHDWAKMLQKHFQHFTVSQEMTTMLQWSIKEK